MVMKNYVQATTTNSLSPLLISIRKAFVNSSALKKNKQKFSKTFVEKYNTNTTYTFIVSSEG
jgi:hypothetical protein